MKRKKRKEQKTNLIKSLYFSVKKCSKIKFFKRNFIFLNENLKLHLYIIFINQITFIDEKKKTIINSRNNSHIKKLYFRKINNIFIKYLSQLMKERKRQ